MLLDLNGDLKHEINLSFDYLTDQYLTYVEEHTPITNNSSIKIQGFDSSSIKITDNDLLGIWEHIDETYHLSFNIEGQDISDETILKISELYIKKKCSFNKLKFSGNSKITGVSIAKLGQSLQDFTHIE